MAFEARLRIPGSTRLPLGVEVDIANERLVVKSGDRKLADWSLQDLQVSALPDGFHVKADGEEVILNVADSAQFAGRLGISETSPAPQASSESTRRKYAEAAKSDTDPGVNHLERRIADAAEALTSESMSPEEAFSLWIGLLKELNDLHGEGSLGSETFHRLNTELLSLLREP